MARDTSGVGSSSGPKIKLPRAVPPAPAASDMAPYQYSPLKKEPDSIRLLRLLPSGNDEAKIQIELLEYSLPSSRRTSHSYEALSYVWGGLNTTQSILIGEKHLDVTHNLHIALLRLRDTTFPRILWIDALCINQKDDEEKALQIQSMANIYGNAKRTIVWLGEEADGSSDAIEAIRVAGLRPLMILSNEDDGDVEEAVDALLRREWFQRIWVR
jgi:hypothetical protein